MRSLRGLVPIVLLLLSIVAVEPDVTRDAVSARPSPAFPAGVALHPTATGPLEKVSSIRVPVGSDISDIAVDTFRWRGYAADRTNDRVLVVSTENGTVEATIPVRAEPIALAIDLTYTVLFVGHAANPSILAINLSSLSLIREIPLPFLPWSLQAPRQDRLVVTVHDHLGGTVFPYILNATDGSIVQRLDMGLGTSSFEYRDSLARVTGDGERLYLANGRGSSLTVQAYARADFFRGNYSFLGSNPQPSSLAGNATDLEADWRDGPIHIGRGNLPALRLEPSTLDVVSTFGGPSASVESSGSRIAIPAAANRIDLYEETGVLLGNFTTSGPVTRLRDTFRHERLLTVVGAGPEDLEIVNATAVVPLHPLGFTRQARPELAAIIASLAPPQDVSVGMYVDGQPANAWWCSPPYVFCGPPESDLAEGRHTVRVRVWGGLFYREHLNMTWEFVADFTPPLLVFGAIPPAVSESVFTLAGSIVEPYLAVLTADGQTATVDPSGSFSVQLVLDPGPNLIEVYARDEAGNENRYTLSITYTALDDWFLHPAKHFRLRPPLGWATRGNVTVGNDTVDLIVIGPDGSSLIVVSESRAVEGTYESARAILQEAIDGLSSSPDFFIIIPVAETTIDGHAAAQVMLRVAPNGTAVRQILTVVVGPEWRMFWALFETIASSGVNTEPWLEASVESFDVLGPGGTQPPLLDAVSWIFLGAAVAGAVAITVVVLILLRRRRPPVT